MTWWLAHSFSIKFKSKSNLHNVCYCSWRELNNRWILFNRNNSIQISKYIAIKGLVDFLVTCGQHPSMFSVAVKTRLCTNGFWIPVNMTRPATGVCGLDSYQLYTSSFTSDSLPESFFVFLSKIRWSKEQYPSPYKPFSLLFP